MEKSGREEKPNPSLGWAGMTFRIIPFLLPPSQVGFGQFQGWGVPIPGKFNEFQHFIRIHLEGFRKHRNGKTIGKQVENSRSQIVPGDSQGSQNPL